MLTVPKSESRPILNSVRLLLALTLVLTLLDCGGGETASGGGSPPGSNLPPPPGSPSPLLADNWQFNGKVGGREIGAALNITESTIAGAAHVFDNGAPHCYDFYQGISLSGSIDSQGNVSVSSSQSSGQVLTFTGILNSDRSSISLGNYAFRGGCASGDSGLLTGQKFKPVAGVYRGILNNPTPIALAANLTQSSKVSGNGFLLVSGTVTYTSPSCSEEFAITTSQLAGRFIQLYLAAKDGKTTWVYGNVNPEADQIELADYDGSCGGGGTGVLTRK
jgi:hypothetical protein